MIKTFFKETFIILLLCIAILLVLSVLFYDYNPISKVIPNKIAYTTPENIKEELEEESLENTISIENKVYTIEDSDLTIYKRSKSYDPSKENPFASSEETTNTVGNNGVSNNVGIKNQNTQNNNQGSNTTNNGNSGNSNNSTNSGNKPSKLK